RRRRDRCGLRPEPEDGAVAGPSARSDATDRPATSRQGQLPREYGDEAVADGVLAQDDHACGNLELITPPKQRSQFSARAGREQRVRGEAPVLLHDGPGRREQLTEAARGREVPVQPPDAERVSRLTGSGDIAVRDGAPRAGAPVVDGF